jgi:hypothetical protein
MPQGFISIPTNVTAALRAGTLLHHPTACPASARRTGLALSRVLARSRIKVRSPPKPLGSRYRPCDTTDDTSYLGRKPSFTRAQFEQISELLADAWISGPTDAQEHELDGWLPMLARTQSRLAVVELGAGKAIPTVRIRAERTAAAAGVPLISQPRSRCRRRAGGPRGTPGWPTARTSSA